MIEKIGSYIEGLLLALMGKYPFKELEHLEFIQVQIKEDARWLCVVPSLRDIVERHETMVSDTWRSIQFVGVSKFREHVIKEEAIRNKQRVEGTKK